MSARGARRVGLAWHELFAWHDIGTVSAHLPAGGPLEPDAPGDSGARVRRIRSLLEVAGLMERLNAVPVRAATDEELERVHDREYLRRLDRDAQAGGGDAGEMAPFGRDSVMIARLAAGACLACVEQVMAGELDAAYALVRPPGHHAERGRGRGFCLLANTALAAAHARASGAARVAVLDWDVHHGNGTQAAFWSDPSVLTVSVHQERAFPVDSGAVGERGDGDGFGYNVNVPLPAGSGTGAYLAALDAVALPAIERFEPQLVLVACGLDAGALDPYGRMLVHSEGFGAMCGRVRAVADRVCAGRIVLCHEGGYSTAHAPLCALAVLESLVGTTCGVADPFLPEMLAAAGQELCAHQADYIRQARDAAPLLERVGA